MLRDDTYLVEVNQVWDTVQNKLPPSIEARLRHKFEDPKGFIREQSPCQAGESCIASRFSVEKTFNLPDDDEKLSTNKRMDDKRFVHSCKIRGWSTASQT